MPRKRLAYPWMSLVGKIVREMSPCRLDDAAARIISLVPPHFQRQTKRLPAARQAVIRTAGAKYVVIDGILQKRDEVKNE